MMRFFRSVPIIILLLLGLLIAYNNKISPQVFAINVLVLIAFIYLDVYIHEFGHVIAAKLVGIGVKRVIIGTGKELFRKTIFGVPVVIMNKLGGGFTFMGSMGEKLIKPRFAFSVAGGLILQSLLVAACLVLFGTKSWIGINFSSMFVISNIFMIVMGLFPVHISSQRLGQRIPTDGLTLLKVPFLKEQDINELLFADRIFKAYELFEKKKYRAAATAYKKYIRECPTLTILRLNLSIALLKLLNLEKAENILIQLSKEAEIKKFSYLIYNCLAWINLLYYTDKSLKKAANFSKMAFELNSKLNSIIGTRGSVLIALGSYDDGIKLLSRITNLKKKIDSRINNASNFIFLAYAYFMIKNSDRGCQYLNRAESFYRQMEPDEKYIFKLIRSRIRTETRKRGESI